MKIIRFLLYPAKSALFLALFLAGCGMSRLVTPTPFSTILPSKTNISPMITPTVLGTVTNTATIPPTETPAPTFSPTPTATWTPQPTLPPEEAQALVLDLIATNGGCRLPCWWGITPGETSWEETRSFLETFATSILSLRENVYGITYRNHPEGVSDVAIGATILVDDGIVQGIRTGIDYPLADILQSHGQPQEVWIYADAQSIDALAPFTIALFYEHQGFLAVYRGTTEKGDMLQICPSTISNNRNLWFLWSSKLEMTFEKAGREVLLFVSLADKPFRMLEKSTNIDTRTFYETYRYSENASICFQWSDPRRK